MSRTTTMRPRDVQNNVARGFYHYIHLMLSRNGSAQRRCQRYRHPAAHRRSDRIPERCQGRPERMPVMHDRDI